MERGSGRRTRPVPQEGFMAISGLIDELLAPASAPCPHHAGGEHCRVCKVRNVSVCAALEPDELALLSSLSEDIAFADKTTLLMQGDPALAVYNLTEGVVRLYRLLADGRRQIVGFLLPGDFLGLALSDHYAFSADAIGHVQACRFTRAAFTTLVDDKPHLLRRLHQAATHELTQAQDHMVLLGRRNAEEKVATFLLSLRDRMVRLGHSAVTLSLPMTRQDMADYLGLTLETVSRTISRLGRERVLMVVPDGVRILDPRRLEQLGAA
jgi:CRP/FNR family transcriptional regulator